jgi:archaellum biogenesis ATPase FlaH
MRMGTSSNYNFEGDDIEKISKVTCRIETQEEKGTGVLFLPEDSEFVYLITAKHCLLGKDFSKCPDKKNTKIFIPVPLDKQFEIFCLEKADNILFPEEPGIDCAVIVFRKVLLPDSCRDIPRINFLELRYTSGKCIFRGYPQSYGSIVGVNIHVNYSDNDLVTTNIPLSTHDSDPLYNCNGFSGSGLFCQLNKKLYLIGLISELQEPFQRFKVCNFIFLNKLLSGCNYPTIEFSKLPGDETRQEDIRKLSEKTDLILDGINHKIGNDLYLERKEVIKKFREKFNGNKLLIITGNAGVGKSVLAKVIVQELKKENYFPLAFKADFFARESFESALKDIYINNSIGDVLNDLGQKQQIIILIDSLEKLLEVQTHEALNEFLRICKKFDNIRILVTCRTYAYQQLVFHFHHDFHQYASFEIPTLSDKEFSEVEGQFSFLENLSNKQSIRKILRRPFYLNLIVLNSQILKKDEEITEGEFKKIIWEKVISKNNAERGPAFEKIAVDRATSMKLYVRAENIHKDIIKQLHNDNIILVEENLGESYSPSHDIYEDIALMRFIERNYQQRQNTLDFFERCGKEPAKRRAFRLWLNDSLFSMDHNLNTFILEILQSDGIEQYWKDELIISILRSTYCQKFFDSNQEVLQKGDFALFLRFIHLLKTACQEPDEEKMKSPLSRGIYWLHLKPVGPGWETVIRFTWNNYDKLTNFKPIILKLLVDQWIKRLRPEREIPPESEIAGRILISLLEEAQKYYDSWKNEPFSTKDVDIGILLLFRLASIFPEYVKNLIKEAKNFEEEASKNRRISSFYRVVLKYALSCFESQELCRVMPDLVIELAQKKWLTPACIRKDDYWHRRMESDFGLVDRYEIEVFPPGIYKTPMFFLLRYHPFSALKLIVNVLNHATEAYAQSKRGKRSGIVEIEIEANNGEITRQKGNEVLWAMYRGTIEATHYLLQSILMTLESWLLDLCKINEDWASRLIEFTFDFLLKKSKTVATTAVLASIAIAYPGKIGKNAFPIIKVKEFFEWDLHRCVGDYSSLAPFDTTLPFAQEERIISNNLPHRKLNLEQLVTKLQVDGFWEEINKILDEFKKKARKDDTSWKIKLNRMDFRTYQIDTNSELADKNLIALRPVFSDELKDFVEEGKKEFGETNKAAGILVWAKKVYDNESDAEKTLAKWKEIYKNFKQINKTVSDSAKMHGDPTYLAALGIRDYYLELDPEQQKWCIKTVLDVLEARILKNIRDDSLLYTTIHFQPAIDIVSLILSLNIDEELRIRTKEIVFLSLLHLNYHKMEYPYESIRKNLWKIDPGFANACFAGLIEYSKLHKQVRYHHLPTIEERKKSRLEFFEKEEALMSLVLDEKVKLNIQNLSLDTMSNWFLVFAALILPFETTETSHQKYIRLVFDLLFPVTKKREDGSYSNSENDYTLSFMFQEYLSRFLLSQPKEFSTKFFGEVLDQIYSSEILRIQNDAFDFMEKIIEELILNAEIFGTKNFWYLWEVLEKKIRDNNKPMYHSLLFLSIPWWRSDAEHWPPLENKKDYFKRLITELGCFDIQAVVKLLSGIGTKTLLPDGIIWLKIALQKTQEPLRTLSQENSMDYCEKLVRKIYYKHLKVIKTSGEICQSLIFLLDKMIELGSSTAFIIRERVISL